MTLSWNERIFSMFSTRALGSRWWNVGVVVSLNWDWLKWVELAFWEGVRGVVFRGLTGLERVGMVGRFEVGCGELGWWMYIFEDLDLERFGAVMGLEL